MKYISLFQKVNSHFIFILKAKVKCQLIFFFQKLKKKEFNFFSYFFMSIKIFNIIKLTIKYKLNSHYNGKHVQHVI